MSAGVYEGNGQRQDSKYESVFVDPLDSDLVWLVNERADTSMNVKIFDFTQNNVTFINDKVAPYVGGQVAGIRISSFSSHHTQPLK